MQINSQRSTRNNFAGRRIAASILCLAGLLFAHTSRAQDSAIRIDPGQTKVEYSLGSTLHTVHGTFALKSSSLRFDPASGKIGGEIIVDATSGQSGNSDRDARMHREILESAKFPDIAFAPANVKGAVASSGPSKVEVSGKFRLHGQDHDITIPVEVTAEGQNLQIAMRFVIPYVGWGLKNPSNFFLRASDKVEIDIHASGHMENAMASH